MSDRQHSESKNKRVFKSSSSNNVRQAQARQLLKEIDKLALLLYETKRQSDRVQAIADAMGDAILGNLEEQLAALGGRKKPTSVSSKAAGLRSRTDKTSEVLSKSPELQPAPQRRPSL